MTEITYSKLSINEIPNLLEAIKSVLIETEAHDLMGAHQDSWNWQYKSLPSSESHIYVAKDNNKIIGYYHIPTYKLKTKNQELKIGHIQAVAIQDSYRGSGVFRKLAEFANEEINHHVDLVYTFPNEKSIHTFTKYNQFQLISALPVYILPLDLGNIIASRYQLPKFLQAAFSFFTLVFHVLKKGLQKNEEIVLIPDITQETEELFIEHGKKYTFRLHRDKKYLTWRYLDSPKGTHKVICLKEEKIIKAVAIIKKEKMFSSEGLVVMDVAYKDKKYLYKLMTNLSQVDIFDDTRSADFIFISGLDEYIRHLKKYGFIPIPQKLVPRQLHILGRWTKATDDKKLFKSSSWFITLGDWDVF
ncbi:MAG: GNAT family N-acetyltransferase [SAR86 cluster bacterium]|nr:GNAT family N-acetyltransferase [SAR86 cluster bacterium]|tara:strand:- start:299 stop:1375 length:1077 start_codon:yes stop_codon:yes gene_type:complete